MFICYCARFTSPIRAICGYAGIVATGKTGASDGYWMVPGTVTPEDCD